MKKSKKRKLKKKVYLFLAFFSFLAIIIISFILYKNYVTSNKYLLLEKGYSVDEVVEYLNNPKLVKVLLENEYNKDIIRFVREDYFIDSNLRRYLSYRNENLDKSFKDIVSIVNVGADSDWYENSVKTDMSKGNLILVNKYNYLNDTYEPEDLKSISVRYAFAGKEVRSEVLKAFVNLSTMAKSEGLTIIANSAFRGYDYQSKLYKNYNRKFGLSEADRFAARPGYSEHQTGLVLDVSTLTSTMDNFEDTDEYEWLVDNAHKYGFILRYPKGKEDITGYNFESWHYRYVGNKVASEIKEKDITFDEYYAYYLR